MSLRPCDCGRDVALRAMRIRVNRCQGIAHWIEHTNGGRVCAPGDWSASMMKPYPKQDADKDWWKMRERWNQRPHPMGQP